MDKKYYFYILRCNDGYRYYGHTNNLSRRLNDHLNGKVESTNSRRPVELAYYKECNSRSEAFNLEMKFKNGKTRRETIEKLIKLFPKAKCQGFNSRK